VILGDLDTRAGLLIDSNLLVLWIVGSVNPQRMSQFKRTSQYSRTDYELLVAVVERFNPLTPWRM
jgi:hypothetical protein